MSRIIYVTSNRSGDGKTSLSLAIALEALSRNINVGYFKPISLAKTPFEDVDPDVAVMKNFLNKDFRELSSILSFSAQDVFAIDRAHIDKAIQQIKERVAQLTGIYELLILEGVESLSFGASLNISAPFLADLIRAKLLLIARPENDQVVDDILILNHYCRRFNSKIEAVVFNRVPEIRIERASSKYREVLMSDGIGVRGVVPERSELLAPTVKDLNDYLRGEVLAGETGMNKLAENILVGAMSIENAAKFIRRAHNSVIITGGDRTDLALIALEARVSGIILTGGIYPSVKILPKADELSIPIILVPYDTYTALQIANSVRGKILPGDKQRIETLKSIYWNNIDLENILEL